MLDLQPVIEDNNNLDLQSVDDEKQYQRPEGDKGWEIRATPEDETTLFGRLGKALKGVAQTRIYAYMEGNKNVKAAELNAKEIFNPLTETERSTLTELENEDPRRYGVPTEEEEKAASHTGDDVDFTTSDTSLVINKLLNDKKRADIDTFRNLPTSIEVMKAGGIGSAVVGGVGAIGGALWGLRKGKPVEGLKEGFSLGIRLGGGAGAARKSFELEAGFARQELKNLRDNDGKSLPTDLVNNAAISIGVMNAGLESLGMLAELKTFPGADKLFKNAKKDLVKEIATNETLRNKLIQVGKTYAQSIAIESSTEMVQEFNNILVGELSKKIVGNFNDTPLNDHIARIISAGVGAIGPSMLIGGVGTVATTANILHKNGMEKTQAEKTAKNMDINSRANFINQNLDTLDKLADDHITDVESKDIEKNFFDKAVNAGVDENQAFSAAKLMGVFAKKFGSNVEQMKNWADKLTIKSEKTIEGGVSVDVPLEELTFDDIPEVMYQKSAILAGAAKEEVADAALQWKEKGTDSPYFQKWFGDSKVTDTEGKPLVVYHGTNAEFNTFDRGDVGFHFGTQEQANERMTDFGDGDPHLKAVYLDIKNPLDMPSDVGDWSDLDTVKEYLGEANYEVFTNEELGEIRTMPEMTRALQAKGYDGIVYENQFEGKGKSYIAFSPEQIKSVNNQGTFSKETGNIYHQEKIANVDNSLKSLGYDDSVYFGQNEAAESSESQNEIVKEYKKQVENFIKNPSMVKGQLKLGETPITLIEAGLEQLPMETSTKIIDKVINDKHFIKSSTIKNLPQLLANPLGVFKSKTKENSVIVLIDALDKNGKPVMVAVDKNNSKNGYNVNFIASAYGKKQQFFKDLIRNNMLLKIDKNKIPSWLQVDENLSSSVRENLNSANAIQEQDNNSITNVDNDFNPTNTYFQSAYHGSPYKFDKFSLEHLGKGEGAQAYGWGLYFAGNKEVSEWYRKKLSEDDNDIPTAIIYDGEEIDTQKYFVDVYLALETVYNNGKEAGIKELENEIKIAKDSKEKGNKEYIQSLKDGIKFIKKLDLNKLKIEERNKGQLYKAEIPEDNTMLLWDESFSKQNKDVIEKLEEFEIKHNDNFTKYGEGEYFEFDEDMIGSEIYEELSRALGSDQEASEALNSLGIKGIKYLDGASRSKGEGDYNYVVFDDQAIDVVKTYYQENNLGDEYSDFSLPTGKEINDRKSDYSEYLGYFQESQDKNIIGIMENANPSTLVHEMGHLFLQGLQEFAQSDNEAQKSLEEVNKWLGYTNGGYTVEQHEKFARGFEAYLHSGKAPSNTLRQVFENFKEWLRSVYTHVDEIGIKLTPEVRNVFDNLFSEKSEKEQEVSKLVERVKNITLGKKLTDMQERHKEVSYKILAYALKRNIKGLKTILESNSKNQKVISQQEKIQQELANVDDPFSSGNGFEPEWLEFYSDPGLYEGNDVALAEAAYETIVNKSYKQEMNEYDFLDATEAQYQYLLNDFKKSSDRDVPLAAFWEWLDTVESDFVETYADKFDKDVAYIERFEKMDKFDQAKETIMSAIRGIGTKNTVEQYQRIVIATMDSLNFLTAMDKAKLTNNILRYSNATLLEHQIDNILDIARTMDDIHYKSQMMSKIHQELQYTKNIKQANKTVGKYDYKTNKIFEKIRELDALTQEQANEIRIYIDESIEDNGLSFEEKLINRFIAFKANGIGYSSTESVKALYDDIVKMKIAGKDVKDDIAFEKKLNNGRDIEELLYILESKEKANPVTKLYIDWIANWESALNAVFNGRIKEKYSLLKAERDSDVWINEQKSIFEKKVAEIYNLKGWNFDYKILENLSIKESFMENVEGRQVPKELNKMEILLAWIWNSNEVLHQRLVNQFGEFELERMFDSLTPEDLELGRLLKSTVNGFYPKANDAFIKKYGIDLPRVNNYFPSKVERLSELDLLNDFTVKSTSPSFVKNRSVGVNLLMEFGNPVQMVYSHIDSMGKFINMTETLDRQNRIFKNPLLKRFVSDKYGEFAYKTLLQSLANSSYKQNAKIYNGAERIIGGIIQNWITGNVAFKPSVGIKQLLTASNYASVMPYLKWQVGYLKAWMHPKETIEYMKKIPYLKARFESGGQNEFLKDTIDNSLFSTSKKLKEFFTLNIRMGDIGAIAFGGRPYLEYLMKDKGMSEQEAVDEFINHTQRTMQASEISSLSNFQMSMNKNMIAKMFTAYQNAQFQYMRMAGDSIVSYANGEMTKGQMAKNLFMYMYLNPLLYRSATSLSVITALAKGDTDDLKDDLVGSIFDLNASCITIFGNIYQYAMNKLLGQEQLPERVPLQGDINNHIDKISKDGVELSDYLQFAGYGAQVFTGVPVNAVGASLSGAGDIAQGKPLKGTLKLLGWSEKRAAHASGEKEKKKHRKKRHHKRHNNS